MRYEVVWKPTAEQELAAVWVASDDRAGVTGAAEWFDRHLAHDPFKVGESRAATVQRLAYHGPIAVEFEIIEDDKRVVVRGVTATG